MTEFTVFIPPASSIRVISPKIYHTPERMPIHRIHPDAYGAAQFNNTHLGNARFSPIKNTDGIVIPTIYGAESFECAVAEIILRSPDTPTGSVRGIPHIVYERDYISHLHSSVIVRNSLKLLDLTTQGQRQIGIDGNALLAGPRSTYTTTRGWAEEIHRRFSDIQGLFYHSYQLSPAWAIVLFGDRIRTEDLIPIESRAISGMLCRIPITALARKLGIRYHRHAK